MNNPYVPAGTCLLGHMVVYISHRLCSAPSSLLPDMAPDSLLAQTSHHGPHVLTVFPRVLSSLLWWTDPCHVYTEVPFLSSSTDKMIIINASLVGRGAHMGNHITQGAWTPREFRRHINILEFRAVRKACQAFLLFICSYHVLIMLNNITTVFYINKQGHEIDCSVCTSGQSLELAHRPSYPLVFSLSPRDMHVIVDSLSRQFAIDHERELYDSVVCAIFN